MHLRQFRRTWLKKGRTLQLAALTCLIGGQALQAKYIPDTSLQPVWQSTEEAPESGPDISDFDTDGLPAWYETWLGTDPVLYDSDYDGINDGDEVATTQTDPMNWDSDGNGQSDLADFYSAHPPVENPGTTPEEASTTTEQAPPADTDADGLTDDYETTTSATDPAIADSDGNGRSDYDDHYYPVVNPDTDSDGVPDMTETTEGTDPTSVDSDGDGLTDGEETNVYHTDPNNAYSRSTQYTDWYMVDTTDSDSGGIPDRIETYLGMNPQDATDDVSGDLDGDGETNAEEYSEGNSPDSGITESYDNDGDGMTDVWEVTHELDSNDANNATDDPDEDNFTNSEEYHNGTDPNVPDETPEDEEVDSELTLTYEDEASDDNTGLVETGGSYTESDASGLSTLSNICYGISAALAGLAVIAAATGVGTPIALALTGASAVFGGLGALIGEAANQAANTPDPLP